MYGGMSIDAFCWMYITRKKLYLLRLQGYVIVLYLDAEIGTTTFKNAPRSKPQTNRASCGVPSATDPRRQIWRVEGSSAVSRNVHGCCLRCGGGDVRSEAGGGVLGRVGGGCVRGGCGRVARMASTEATCTVEEAATCSCVGWRCARTMRRRRSPMAWGIVGLAPSTVFSNNYDFLGFLGLISITESEPLDEFILVLPRE
jgi:hypothetical protein